MPLTMLDTVQPEAIRWLWHGRLPFGKLAILDGDGGLGKTTIMLDIAARLSTGAALPDGTMPTEPMSSLLLTVEDGLADTIRPRLSIAGADLSRIGALQTAPEIDPRDGPFERMIAFPDDIAYVEAMIAQLPQPVGLVVIDPVMSFLGEGVNSHRDQDVRRALAPLTVVAERTGAAIVCLRHLNKGVGPAAYRGNGSVAFVNLARTGLVVGRDPQDQDRFVLARSKGNLGKPPPALAYRLVEGGDGHPRVAWGGAVDLSADQLLARPDTAGEGDGDAADVLREVLSKGPIGAKIATDEMKKAGFGDYTTRQAKRAIGVRVTKDGGLDGVWLWSLPAPPAPPRDQSGDPVDRPNTNAFNEINEIDALASGQGNTAFPASIDLVGTNEINGDGDDPFFAPAPEGVDLVDLVEGGGHRVINGIDNDDPLLDAVNRRRAARRVPQLPRLLPAATMGLHNCLACGDRGTFYPGEPLVCAVCRPAERMATP